MTQPGSVIASEVELGSFSAPESEFRVSEVSIKTGDGAVLKGVKLQASNPTASDAVLLESERIPQLIQELEEIEQESECAGMCIHGIARCRPSQSERQAYCFGYIYSSDGEHHGTLFRTANHPFQLNEVMPADVIEALKRYSNIETDGT